MIRLFVAMSIPEEILDEVIHHRNKIAAETGLTTRWVPKENLHLTLKFIGEVEDSKLEKIIHSLTFIQSIKKINCSLGNFGFFLKGKAPAIFWFDIKVEKHLVELANELNKKLTDFNIPFENRSFKPHITLARIKEKLDRKVIDTFSGYKLPDKNFYCNEIVLYKSTLERTGARYEKLKSYILL